MTWIERYPLCLVLCLPFALSGAPAHAQARDHLTVVGSSTVYPFATAVAEAVGRRGHWKTPVVESTGTGGGFQLFCKGGGVDTPDVTDASRPMSDAEMELCARNGAGVIVPIRIGSDGIVIASSRFAAPFDLTREQLYRAVAKTVEIAGRLVANPYRRWRDIDPALPDRPISVLGPAPNHGTRDAFAALVMAPPCGRLPQIRVWPKQEQKSACQSVREDGPWTDVSGDYALLLARLVKDRNALGVITFSYLEKNRDKIQAAAIDGAAPTFETIAAWRYPLTRPLYLYVKQSHVGQVPGTAAFLEEFVSNRAAGAEGYLFDAGLVPSPPAYLQLERKKIEALVAAQH